jgi:cytosine/adenosine deaminase-related metal-dependent hydrolase
VRELAQKGSDNHQLLADLIGRGARLTGTESPELLIEELEFNHRILAQGATTRSPRAGSPRMERQARQLLEKRDKFIAAQISQTLQSHEQGLIFLGMLHSLEGRLPRDMTLSILRP